MCDYSFRRSYYDGKYKQLVKNNSYLDEKRFNEKEKEIIGDKSDAEIALGF